MTTDVVDKMEVRHKPDVIEATELKLAKGEVALVFRPGKFGPDVVTTRRENEMQLVMPDAIEGSPFLMTSMITLLFFGGENCQQARHFCIDQTLNVLFGKGLAKEMTPEVGALPN